MTVLAGHAPLHLPPLRLIEDDGITYAIDGEHPNWVAVDDKGRGILELIGYSGPGGTATFDQVVARYAASNGLESGKAWVQVRGFLQDLLRAGLLQTGPIEREPYPGRLALIQPDGLLELWLQVNNACNLSCHHCLVSSGPGGAAGPPLDFLTNVVDRAVELGLERLFLTGGEPFVRRDIVSLIRHASETRGLEVVVLTNGTALKQARRELSQLDRGRVRFQVSIDGACSETNDQVRGRGAFDRALVGARQLTGLGFDLSVATVPTTRNLGELALIPELVKAVGATSHHLMWTHRRGRAAAGRNGFFPEPSALTTAVMQTVRAAEDAGVALDNLEVIKRRVNGVPGVKYDFGNGGWDSLCVFHDASVYPSAALAGEPDLYCGDARGSDLARIVETSPVIRRLREATVARKAALQTDPYRFLTGGGDWEHAWCFSGGDVLGDDPYYSITVRLIEHAMTTLGKEKRERLNRRSGFDAPVVLHAMGDGAIACGTADGALAERPVLTLHSNCVLSFDVDRPRAKVREFYGAAAEVPAAALCCPTKYSRETVDHIPQEVLDRFYGCGSPMTDAGIAAGETVVDLGCGAGIDVFIAAKQVGPGGRAIGIDMTDQMLTIANENRPKVAAALGYDVAEFRKGYLEEIPVSDKSVDLVTSNCVINLSPDKPQVFAEIWRVLKDHGRFLISDIVSDRPVPPHLKVNPGLWGECLVGALTQEEFLAQLERAGHYGLTVRARTYWKDVEGHAFFSVTVEGFKFEKTDGCVFKGHRAVYLGPGKALVDEEGHSFPRNEPYAVCTDTAAKLSRPPYAGMFALLQPGEERVGYACCGSEGTCC